MAAAVWVSFLLDPDDAFRLLLRNGNAVGDDTGVALDAAGVARVLLGIDGGVEPLASASAAAASMVHSRRCAMAPAPKRDGGAGAAEVKRGMPENVPRIALFRRVTFSDGHIQVAHGHV